MHVMFEKMAALIFGLGVSVLLVEIGLRILWNEPGYAEPIGLYEADEELGFRPRPGFSGHYRGASYDHIEIAINSQGLRDEEHTYGAPAGRFRVLVLGDSVTFGAGVSSDETYVARLRSRLREKFSDSVEVINAGVSNYELDQQVIYYQRDGQRYQPDLVVMGVVLNDVRLVDPRREQENMFGAESWQAQTGRWCKICKFIYQKTIPLFDTQRQTYNQKYFEAAYQLWQGESWNRYQQTLLRLNEQVEEKGGRLVLVLFPYTQQFKHSVNAGTLPQDQLRQMGTSESITIIDLLSILDVVNWEELYLTNDNVHLTPTGYAKVADFIYNELVHHKVLP